LVPHNPGAGKGPEVVRERMTQSGLKETDNQGGGLHKRKVPKDSVTKGILLSLIVIGTHLFGCFCFCFVNLF
jgi:hypothetical protein